MGVQRFVGANSREAMHQVRLALGEDALILSSQSIAEGVEILALADDSVAPPARLDEPAPVSPRHALAAYASQASGSQASGSQALSSQVPSGQAATGQAAASIAPASVPRVTAAPLSAPAEAQDFAALSQLLLGEMQQMKALLERPSAASPEPHASLAGEMLRAGFSHELVDSLMEHARRLSPELDGPARSLWLQERLAERLTVLADDASLLAEGGVIALIGPTGVGKTTTTAKLAARFVMRHGADGLALVTTDSFRVGAHEQLRVYAELLGGDVYALGPDDSLDALLQRLASKRLVIIDTVGVSQRDQRLLTQINQLGRIGRPLRLMLVLNAASHGDTLEEVVDSYSRAALATGRPLRECIVSKCDEAPRMAPVLDVAIRHGLRLNYLSTGQQVPEDLHLVDVAALVRQAVNPARPSLYGPQAPSATSTGQRLDGLSRSLLGQGRMLEQMGDGLREHLADFALLEGAWRLGGMPLAQHSALLNEWLAGLPATALPELAALPSPAAVLADLAAAAPVLTTPAGDMLWGDERPVVGATWKMPTLMFDVAGSLRLRPWLAQHLPSGLQQRLHWSQAHGLAQRHLWLACPNRETLQRLHASGQPWLAAANRNQRVIHAGATASLAQWADAAALHASLPLRQRGRWVRLELGQLLVNLAGVKGAPMRAWFGTLRDCDSDARLGQRFWLAEVGDDAELARQAASICRLQACEALPALTQRAWDILGQRQGQLHPDLRLFLASALAAAACRLDQADGAWAKTLRSQLQGLIGQRRNGSPMLLLNALLHWLTINDVLQRLGAATHGTPGPQVPTSLAAAAGTPAGAASGTPA